MEVGRNWKSTGEIDEYGGIEELGRVMIRWLLRLILAVGRKPNGARAYSGGKILSARGFHSRVFWRIWISVSNC